MEFVTFCRKNSYGERGDISHHLPMDRVNELIAKLNEKKILIKRNHDKKYDSELFEEICDFKAVSLNGYYPISVKRIIEFFEGRI